MNAAPLSEARQAVTVCEREGPTVAAYDRPLPRTRPVVCLSCGHGYPKPANQGSYLDNPGCPVCDYAGWAEATSHVRMTIMSSLSRRAAGPAR
jgi:hypothetical protein